MASDLNKAARRSILFSIVFEDAGSLSIRGLILTLLPFLAMTSLVVLGTWIDGTLRIQGTGVGLFEHFGFLVYTLITPCALILAALILRDAIEVLGRLEDYAQVPELPPPIQAYRRYLLRALCLKGRAKYILYLFVVIGLLSSVVNVLQTIDPIRVYGNDVFDSVQHPWGFGFAKLYILLTWSTVYPLCAYVGIQSGFLLPMLLGAVSRRGVLKVDLFHADNCGGMSRFGKINALTMFLQATVFVFLYALYNTHVNRSYLTMILPLFAFSVVFILQSLLGVLHIQRAIATERYKALARVSSELAIHFSSATISKDFPSGLLGVREHLLRIRSFPYNREVAVAVNVLRFVPSIIGILKLVKI